MWVLTILDESEREKKRKKKGRQREKWWESEQEKERESERKFSQLIETVNLGGLDLSRSGLDRESRSWECTPPPQAYLKKLRSVWG